MALILTEKERRLVARAGRKIQRIRRDLASARGLTAEEAEVAAKVGLISPDQRWWWTEEWQRGERVAERDSRAGQVKSFQGVKDLGIGPRAFLLMM